MLPTNLKIPSKAEIDRYLVTTTYNEPTTYNNETTTYNDGSTAYNVVNNTNNEKS